MNQEDIKKNSSELMTMLIQGTVALSTIQGIELGFFDWIPLDKAVTAQELSGQMGFDISKVERWLRFAASQRVCEQAIGGYTLTAKGSLIRRTTPAPDLLGLHHMFSYFTKAVQYSTGCLPERRRAGQHHPGEDQPGLHPEGGIAAFQCRSGVLQVVGPVHGPHHPGPGLRRRVRTAGDG